MMQDLTTHGINYSMPEFRNTTVRMRTLKSSKKGSSSLPAKIVLKDPDGATHSIKNI